MKELRDLPPCFLTLLRDILQHGKDVKYRVIWKSCQWDSIDGTEEELFEMFRHHGTPGEVSIYQGK